MPLKSRKNICCGLIPLRFATEQDALCRVSLIDQLQLDHPFGIEIFWA